MVAPQRRFPLVRWPVLVCSFNDLRNSGACSPCHTEELKGLDLLAGQGKLKLMQGLKGDKITHAE
jgi:hypothetical protein